MGLDQDGAQTRFDPPEQGGSCGGLGTLIHQRRTARRLTLQQLADLVGCAKSYLSAIENEKRDHPPSPELLERLEAVLGLARGELVRIAEWRRTPEPVKREVEELVAKQRATRELLEMLGKPGPPSKSLDELYRSGELRRLIERVAPEDVREEERTRAGLPVLHREIPLINKVAAGYPREFTDLGYPARVADEYVRAPGIDDPDAFAARVVGDSMLPEYREGDIVVFSALRPVKSGMDCFARLEPDHETTFKRVYFEKGQRDRGTEGQSEEEMIRLQPLNPAYAARVVRREEVAGLYAAVSVTRML
jgi:transcriptional regulator with XRE-family HTH domain